MTPLGNVNAALAEIQAALPDWKWTLYGPSEHHGPRAVLVNPDFRIQVGEDGKTPAAACEAALRSALAADAARRRRGDHP